MDAIIEGLLYVQGDIGLTIKDIMNILNIDEETAKREVLNLKNYYDDNKRVLELIFWVILLNLLLGKNIRNIIRSY